MTRRLARRIAFGLGGHLRGDSCAPFPLTLTLSPRRGKSWRALSKLDDPRLERRLTLAIPLAPWEGAGVKGNATINRTTTTVITGVGTDAQPRFTEAA